MSARNYREELRLILNGLADSLANDSDESMLAEVREDGEDPELLARSAQIALGSAFKTFKQKKLREAQLKHKDSVLKLKEIEQNIPRSITDLRALLTSFFTAQPHWKSQLLTAQCRDLKELTECDARSIVRQLKLLGALNALPESDSNKHD